MPKAGVWAVRGSRSQATRLLQSPAAPAFLTLRVTSLRCHTEPSVSQSLLPRAAGSCQTHCECLFHVGGRQSPSVI